MKRFRYAISLFIPSIHQYDQTNTTHKQPKATTYMKPTSLHIAAAIALFTCAATSQAAPAHAKAKTARIDEIHCNEKMSRDGRPSATAPTADEASLFRSRAELEMVNAG